MNAPLTNPSADTDPTVDINTAPAIPPLMNPMVHIPTPDEMSPRERRETFTIVKPE